MHIRNWPSTTEALRHARLASVAMVLVYFGCQSRLDREAASSAQALNTRGMAAKDPVEAKKLFLQAVAADPFLGPAQNNLGVIYLNEGNYFEAARAFDAAIKLMPSNPVPRIHLGLAYENAGQLRNALEEYDKALELAPDSIDAIQAAARVQIRLDQVDEKAIQRLRMIAEHGTDESWRSWAHQMLAKYGSSVTTTRP